MAKEFKIINLTPEESIFLVGCLIIEREDLNALTEEALPTTLAAVRDHHLAMAKSILEKLDKTGYTII